MRKDKGKVKKDLTGQRFSYLSVINFDSWIIQGKNTQVSFWFCKCDCGNYCKVKGTHLSRGDTKSCGCYKPGKLEKGKAAFNRLLDNYKRHAKNRNYDWYLTDEQFKKLTQDNCFYCGIEPKQKQTNIRGNGEYIYNGVDRLNNEPYYKVENTVSCCGLCNSMKSDLTLDEFYKHIKDINGRIK